MRLSPVAFPQEARHNHKIRPGRSQRLYDRNRWVQARTANGASGWVYSRYITPLEDAKAAYGTTAGKTSPAGKSGPIPTREAGGASAASRPVSKRPPANRDYAQGFLEVDGRKVPLRHAYMTQEPDAFDPTRKIFVVYLTDQPVTSQRWRDRLKDLAYEGKLQCVELDINQSREVIAIVMESPLLRDGYISSAGGHRFDVKTWTSDVVSGTANTQMREPGGQRYRYCVTFRATLKKGDAAQKAP